VSERAAAASAGHVTSSAIPPTVGPDVMKQAFRHHAAGVAVVTADIGEGPIAMTVSSLTSVSVDPAVLLFSVSAATETGRAMARADTVVVHLLDGADHELAVACAMPGSDRFGEASAWERLASGEPAFRSPLVRLRGAIVQRSVFGGSTVLVLAVLEELARDDDGPSNGPRPGPLAYHDRAWHVLGQGSALG